MIILFNPLSTTPGKQPLPLSLLSLAAALEGRHPWRLVDGNLVSDPAAAIIQLVKAMPRPEAALLAVTVMPGPQLVQAVPVCRRIRRELPALPIVWGGYFPTQHADTVLNEPCVDFVVRSQGEQALLDLVETLNRGGSLGSIGNLSWRDSTRITHNALRKPTLPDELPDIPYHTVQLEDYIHPDYLGTRTIAHSSSFGCPFACNFCAVVTMSNRRWLAQSPARMEGVLRHLTTNYRIDAVQMHDMDFFISEDRTAELCDRVVDLGIAWWGLGRIDTLMHYTSATWSRMKRSGLKMVFSGVESGSAKTLAAMNKGGNASPSLTLELARRMAAYGIVPEFSFVLGTPPDPEANVRETIEFIRRIKRINPATEIVMYVYTPVPLDGLLYEQAKRAGFTFPQTLDEWTSEHWYQLSLRRGDRIPWVNSAVRRQVQNFERVLNAYYPTVTDQRLGRFWRAVLRGTSAWRYATEFYGVPYELGALQRLIRYQRPETTGF